MGLDVSTSQRKNLSRTNELHEQQEREIGSSTLAFDDSHHDNPLRNQVSECPRCVVGIVTTTRLTDRKMNTLQLTGLLRHDIRYWRSEAIKLCDSSSVESCRNLALEVCENIETLRCVGTRSTPPSFAGWVLTVALTLFRSPRSALTLCRLFAACVRLGIEPYIAIAMGLAFWVGVALGVGGWMVWRWL